MLTLSGPILFKILKRFYCKKNSRINNRKTCYVKSAKNLLANLLGCYRYIIIIMKMSLLDIIPFINIWIRQRKNKCLLLAAYAAGSTWQQT